MNIKAIVFVFFMLALLLTACGSIPLMATPTPTAVPTPTTDPLQSAKVVQAFWDAMAAEDLETAMAYIGEDIQCSGFCYFKGKATFQTYMQGYLDAGYLTKISDIRTVGSIVTYSWQVYRNGNFVRGGESDEMMQVEEGKIIYWENQHR